MGILIGPISGIVKQRKTNSPNCRICRTQTLFGKQSDSNFRGINIKGKMLRAREKKEGKWVKWRKSKDFHFRSPNL